MNTIGKIVGINLVILVVYCIGVSFIDGFENEIEQAFLLGIILIPTHFLVCLITGIAKKLSNEGSVEKRKLQVRGYLLSAFIVLVVGFPACFLVASL